MMVEQASSARLQARAQSEMTTAPEKPPVPTGSIPQRIVGCDQRPSDAAVERFQKVLIDHNISAFVRKNRGNDISAACGQLKKKWADEPQNLSFSAT
jgi:hypothetical protein